MEILESASNASLPHSRWLIFLQRQENHALNFDACILDWLYLKFDTAKAIFLIQDVRRNVRQRLGFLSEVLVVCRYEIHEPVEGPILQGVAVLYEISVAYVNKIEWCSLPHYRIKQVHSQAISFWNNLKNHNKIFLFRFLLVVRQLSRHNVCIKCFGKLCEFCWLGV